MISMKWFFGEKEDLSDVHVIRREVFMEEQNVPAAHLNDGTDAESIHVVVYDENEKPVSTGRVHITDDDFIIGRVATVKSHRSQGLATGIMQALIEACVQMGGERQLLHSQTEAQGFYEKLGFTPYGEEFEKAGIPHIAMEHFGSIKRCGGGGHCGGCGKGH
ncbi:MAG: GNAT family N-acetyltransferase [Defluviitaleaceae bacterium]|nr:GNAT family N-acetyltransferase [Defluviitaleaceae bacterium]